jgi:GT2 family glycosyltransferase
MKSGEATVELVAVINSFNRCGLLRGAILSLAQALRHAPFGTAIIVYEAGSTDGSREFIADWQKEYPEDHLIVVTPAEQDRSSFSNGVNAGCAEALKRFPTCQWLLLYETDNFLEHVQPLLSAIALLRARPELAAAGFTVTRHDETPCAYGMRFPSFASLALGENLSLRWHLHRPNESSWQEANGIRWRTCDVVFTSPLLIRRRAWEESGGFDVERFPFSDSDLDWAWRCAEADWKMGVIATAGVVHDNLTQASAWSANRMADLHRSRLRLLRQHRGPRAALLKPLLFLRHAVEAGMLMRRAGSDAAAAGKLQTRRQMLRTVWHDYS